MTTYERRVTLALKWHHLDNLSPEEIRDRFAEEDIGNFALSTIRGYLNSEPADEVLEQIEQEHANVRLQAAERFERLYQDARHDLETLAVEDEPVMRTVPKMGKVSTERESPMPYPDWEFVEPGDDGWPGWATERDIVVRFTDERTQLMPGEKYPERSIDGSPSYTTEMVGLRRDEPDLQKRQFARKEMAGYVEEKADVLGVYSTDINMTVDGEMETTLSLDAEAAAAIREADLDDE